MPNLMRLKCLRKTTTTTCIVTRRKRKYCQWMTRSPRECGTRFPRAVGRMQNVFCTPFRCNCRLPRCITCLVIPAPLYTRMLVVQPGRCGDTIVNSVENTPHLEGPTQFLAGRLSIPGGSASAADGFWLRNCSYIGAAGGGPAETDGDGENCVNFFFFFFFFCFFFVFRLFFRHFFRHSLGTCV